MRHKSRTLRESIRQCPITISRNPILNKGSKILTIGSCFASEIKHYLSAKGYNVLNKELPHQLIWYNTYTIFYEFSRVVKEFYQEDNDIWKLKKERPPNLEFNGIGRYQDPYRRCVFEETPKKLLKKIRKIDSKMSNFILEADVIIITLGLTEVFFQDKNGLAICACPGYSKGGGRKITTFRCTEYNDNYDNIKKSIEIIRKINPKCKVVLTVSPVPLGRTFTESDHIVANTESKSILRSVAGAIVRKYDNVHYFHSYEMVLNLGSEEVFKSDARHVKPEFVKLIMKEFEEAYVE